ncbi:hypothetical protein TL16_g07505 [Triparma laevis f. inornata]|uniref:Solute carrier family 40 member n=1 Tax=Triparma laevis f. inornata TaxID=1714386 RepID=A0A9W7AXD5_9STRA|nr:hypothetical protein TL16_g07505 [Triparma laevis f. inornata]
MGNQPARFKARTEVDETTMISPDPIDEETPDVSTLSELDSLLPSRPALPSFYDSTPRSTPSPDPDKQQNNRRHHTVNRRHTLLAEAPPAFVRPTLYTSHFTSQWAERTWEFTIVLLLTYIGPQDRALLLVSSYGLFCALSSLVTLGAVGAFIDRANRITAFRLILLWQNFSVIAATAACFALLVMKHDVEKVEGTLNFNSPFYLEDWTIYLIVMVHVFGASAQIASSGSTVSIEKDWVPEIAKTYQDPGWLTQTNVSMRQIDLGCKVLAPVFAGFVIEFCGKDNLESACIAMGVFNVLTILCEWICSRKVYNEVSALHTKAAKGFIADSLSSFSIFFSSKVALPGLALALLYINIMSYGSIMLAYVSWRGMSAPLIGLTRGISATIGLLGTIAFQFSSKHTGINFTGFWSIIMQGVFLGVSFSSIFFDDTQTSLVLLISGVCMSRIGLWAFDLAVSQQMQEMVPENERGAVGGSQSALCSMFEMLSYVFGLIWSRPEEFNNLVTISYGGQLLAVVCYCIFYAGSAIRK